MFDSLRQLEVGKKVYFASDMHFGAPNKKESLPREKLFVKWLKESKADAAAIILLGDIFDFWFEYKHSIPKGYSRLMGALAETADESIDIFMFTGNHDMWMFNYFPDEMNIPVIKDPVSIHINNKKFFIGHGDGLGPGDRSYKILKKIFRNRFCQWAFARIHPNLGISLANYWSGKSRLHNMDDLFERDTDLQFQFCLQKEAEQHHDYYVMGHRHHPVIEQINDYSTYYNLGDWIDHFSYAEFDGSAMTLKNFQDKSLN